MTVLRTVLRVCTVTASRLFGNRAACLCLVAFMLVTVVAGSGLFQSLAQSPVQLSGSDSAAGETTAPQAHAAVSAPATLSPAALSAQPVMQAAANAAPAGPQQQIAQLLQMATDLKAEVDKTNKDELSVPVVRKASAIEHLAHKVKNAWPAKDH